jgi:hypothetical protein
MLIFRKGGILCRKKLFMEILERGVLEENHARREKHGCQCLVKKRADFDLLKRARRMGVQQFRKLRVH